MIVESCCKAAITTVSRLPLPWSLPYWSLHYAHLQFSSELRPSFCGNIPPFSIDRGNCPHILPFYIFSTAPQTRTSFPIQSPLHVSCRTVHAPSIAQSCPLTPWLVRLLAPTLPPTLHFAAGGSACADSTRLLLAGPYL